MIYNQLSGLPEDNGESRVYIGLAKEGQPNNFAIFRPQKNGLRLEVRLSKSDLVEEKLNETGLDLMEYNRWGRYRIRLTKDDVKKHANLLQEIFQKAYGESKG